MADIRANSNRLRGSRDSDLVLIGETFDLIAARLDAIDQNISSLTTRVTTLENNPAPTTVVIPAEGDQDAVINLDGTVDIDLTQSMNWNLLLTKNVTIKAPIRSDALPFKKGDRLSIKFKQDATGFWTVAWNAVFLTGGLDITANPNMNTVFNFRYTTGANWQLTSYISGIS